MARRNKVNRNMLPYLRKQNNVITGGAGMQEARGGKTDD